MKKNILISALYLASSVAVAAPVISTTCDLGKGNSLVIQNSSMIGRPIGPKGQLSWEGNRYSADEGNAADAAQVSYSFGPSTQIQNETDGISKFRTTIMFSTGRGVGAIFDGRNTLTVGDVTCTQVHGFTLGQ